MEGNEIEKTEALNPKRPVNVGGKDPATTAFDLVNYALMEAQRNVKVATEIKRLRAELKAARARIEELTKERDELKAENDKRFKCPYCGYEHN